MSNSSETPTSPDVQGARADERADDADQRLVSRMRAMRLRCPKCSYDLRAAVSTRCPECGTTLTEKTFRIKDMPKSNFLVLAIVGACAWVTLSPVGAIWVGSFVPGPAHAVLALVWLLVEAFSLWLIWWLAWRPMRAVGTAGATRVAMQVLLVVPGVLLIAALVIVPVWVAALYITRT
jgi:ribosomal protein S27E